MKGTKMSMSVRRSMLVVAALVAAVILGSAATFLAVAQATHHAAPELVQAVFTATDLPPASRSFAFAPGHYYEGSQAEGETAVWLLPVDLSGYDLPGGTVIRVHTAAGTTENCTHTTGSGVSTDGVPVFGDGWSCSRATAAPATTAPAATKAPRVDTAAQIRARFAGLTRSDLPAGTMVQLLEPQAGGIQNCSRGSGPRVNADGVSYSGDGWVCVPATAAPRTEAPYREACFGAPSVINPQAWDCFLDEPLTGIASRVGTPPTSIQAARP
jgi:hypothetical protein